MRRVSGQTGRTPLGQRAKAGDSGNYSDRLGPWAHRGEPSHKQTTPCRREQGDPKPPHLPPFPHLLTRSLSAGANQRAKGKEALRTLLKLIVIKGPGHQARFCWSKGEEVRESPGEKPSRQKHQHSQAALRESKASEAAERQAGDRTERWDRSGRLWRSLEGLHLSL